MTTDKALSLVGEIMKAYNSAEQAGASALGHALECGRLLNLAKETVGKGKWKKWCEANLKVSEETERLYRRLADAVANKDDIFAKCKSVRAAMAELAKYDTETWTLKPPRPKKPKEKNGNTVTGLVPPSTVDDADLDHLAGDEIIDADKLEEVAKASFKKLSAEKVSAALIDAWSADQLRDLINRVDAHLKSLTKMPALDIPTVRRAPPAQPSQR
jgi:hypothetical protein